MPDSITQYFAMMKTLHSPVANALTKSIIRSTGLPELAQTTSSQALRNRIAKELSNGNEVDQHAC